MVTMADDDSPATWARRARDHQIDDLRGVIERGIVPFGPLDDATIAKLIALGVPCHDGSSRKHEPSPPDYDASFRGLTSVRAAKDVIRREFSSLYDVISRIAAEPDARAREALCSAAEDTVSDAESTIIQLFKLVDSGRELVRAAGHGGAEAGREAARASRGRPKTPTAAVLRSLVSRRDGVAFDDARALKRALKVRTAIRLVGTSWEEATHVCLVGDVLTLFEESGEPITLSRPPKWKQVRQQAAKLGVIATVERTPARRRRPG
jgi:hypothetical protein